MSSSSNRLLNDIWPICGSSSWTGCHQFHLVRSSSPGGVRRPLLLQLVAFFAAVITIYGVIRSIVLISTKELNGAAVSGALRTSGFVATVGVSIAAATISFYAAKESFLKKEGRI